MHLDKVERRARRDTPKLRRRVHVLTVTPVERSDDALRSADRWKEPAPAS